MKISLFILFHFLSLNAFNQNDLEIRLLPGEKVWSGVISDGERMPYGTGYSFNLYANNQQNQLQPLLLGNKGLWVWSEEPFAFLIEKEKIVISHALGKIQFGHAGTHLADARQYVSRHFFPPSGQMPDQILFSNPQYNTWIELTYHQNQADVIKYARAVIGNGFPPGVIMIDDTWQEDYGLWQFHPGRFPDPKLMVEQLHQMGFKIMVWICPFVSPDQAMIMRDLVKNKALLMQQHADKLIWEKTTDPAIIPWWNGYSASIDFTNPAGVRWFNDQLDRIIRNYGIDGFKFDAGDMDFYPAGALSMIPATPNRLCELYASNGLRFPLNEYRACWKMAGKPLVQRLHDKNHNWEELKRLIPQMIAEGLAGYTFSCPDMIGGGDWLSFQNPSGFNQDIVVRSAQIHALMPMMQFSVAPWRVLDSLHLAAVRKAVAIREKFKNLILELARQSAKTGEPIIGSLEYYYPGQHFETVSDQFMLGPGVLVAPESDAGTNRNVLLPPGQWMSDQGEIFKGGGTYSIQVSLDRLPYFVLQK